jgi:hypothetical protein
MYDMKYRGYVLAVNLLLSASLGIGCPAVLVGGAAWLMSGVS